MRGKTTRQATFTAITPDQKVPKNHPIRRIRALVEPVLKELSPVFEEMYAVIGPSIHPTGAPAQGNAPDDPLLGAE